MEKNDKKKTKKTQHKAYYKLFLCLLMLLVTSVNLISAAEFDNTKSFDETIGNYGKVTIKDWFGLLKLTELELKTNTNQCLIFCNATKEIIMHQKGSLIDEVKFETLSDKGRVEEPIEDYIFLYKINDKWINYELGTEVEKGTYEVRLLGKKAVYKSVDWKIKSQGIWIDEWLIWNTNPPIAYYNFTSTTYLENLVDITKYNGTLFNSPTTDVDVTLMPQGYSFDNVQKEWINITDISFGGYNQSIVMWVQPNWTSSELGGSETRYFYQENDPPQTGIFDLHESWQGYVGFTVGGVLNNTVDPVGWWSAGDWVMLAAVWDTTGDTAKLYVNGVLKIDHTGAFASTTGSVGLAIYTIGNANAFDGNITEVGIWNQTLSQADVTELYNGGSGLAWQKKVTPVVTLDSPLNNINHTLADINFTGSYTAGASEGLTNATYKIWYSNKTLFNETTETISGASNTTTLQINDFPVNSYEWNILVCADDTTGTFCNSAVSNFTFNLQSNVTDINFNATVYETAQENLNINITPFDGITPVNAYLNYNGTEYGATITASGSDYVFDRDIIINSSMIGTNTFYFKWDINGVTEQSGNYTQIGNSTMFDLCNTTLTIPYINFTFKDEDENLENATIDASTWQYWLSSDSSVNKTLLFSNTTENSKYAFCFTPPDRPLNIKTSIQYASDGFPQRKWDNETTLTNSTLNQTLYLLASTDGIYVTFQVVNVADQPLSNVYATARRDIGGVSTLVGAGTTGEDGGVTFWLNPDYSHIFKFTKTGYDDYTTTITPTQSTYTVILGGVAEANTTDYSRGISYFIQPTDNVLSNETTYHFNFTINSVYWELDGYGFTLTNGSGNVLGSVSGSIATGGTVDLAIDTGLNETIIMDYSWVIDGYYFNNSKSWYVTDTGDYGWSIKTFFTDLKNYTDEGIFGLNVFSRTLIIFVIIFLIVGALSYTTGVYSPAAIMWLIFGLVALFDYGLNMLPPVGRIEHFITLITLLIAFGFTIREGIK